VVGPALFSLYNPAGNEQFFSRDFVDAVVGHLAPTLPPALLAAALAGVLTWAAIPVARRLGFVAVPRDRDLHIRPTPVLGGLALYAAFAITVLLLAPNEIEKMALVAITGAAAVILVLDDRLGMPAWLKLGVQTALALVAAAAFGSDLQISYFGIPGGQIIELGLLALPITVVWQVGMANTVNLLDGVDGLAAGVVGIVALILMVAAASKGQADVVAFSAALAGACTGFLFWNWHPARIFMGDSGSNFLGFAIALISILGVAKIAAVFALLLPLLALGVPIVDTAWAIVRRRRRRISIAHPDSRHIHHQLLDFGLSQQQTCTLFYCSSAILGALGLMIFGHRRALAAAVLLMLVPLSTVLGDLLMRSSRRIPAPGLGRLLGTRAVS
jgi:UDP-GlcNAc:undecaprenyl-phosphate/decaprenyl-phosphate GlcNAc-1-phosphate transferase